MKHIINIDELKTLITDCKTFWELSRRSKIGKLRLIKFVKEHKIDISHFTPGKGKSTRSVQRLEIRTCLQCGKEFSADKKFNQKTCSRSCANSYFRSGKNHGSYIDDGTRKSGVYKRICFKTHGKRCIICGESIAVDVHHVDEDYTNNNADNIVPLCANHHRHAHYKSTKNFIFTKIKEYIEIWRNGKLSSL